MGWHQLCRISGPRCFTSLSSWRTLHVGRPEIEHEAAFFCQTRGSSAAEPRALSKVTSRDAVIPEPVGLSDLFFARASKPILGLLFCFSKAGKCSLPCCVSRQNQSQSTLRQDSQMWIYQLVRRMVLYQIQHTKMACFGNSITACCVVLITDP